jgi:hypothetical protein
MLIENRRQSFPSPIHLHAQRAQTFASHRILHQQKSDKTLEESLKDVGTPKAERPPPYPLIRGVLGKISTSLNSHLHRVKTQRSTQEPAGFPAPADVLDLAEFDRNRETPS